MVGDIVLQNYAVKYFREMNCLNKCSLIGLKYVIIVYYAFCFYNNFFDKLMWGDCYCQIAQKYRHTTYLSTPLNWYLFIFYLLINKIVSNIVVLILVLRSIF